MKWKTTAVFVGLFAGLLAYYLLVDRGSKTTQEAARVAKRLFSFEEKDVVSMRIVRAEGAASLERGDAGRWMMTAPIKARADRWAVDAAAGAIADLEPTRTFKNERGEQGLAEMGLAKPRVRVEVSIVKGGAATPAPNAPKTTTIIELGNEVPATNSAFLRVEGRDEVCLVPSSSTTAFTKPIEDLRDRALLDTTILDVGEARIQRVDGEIRFKRRDENWWIESPLEDLAEGSAVQSALSAVLGLRAEKFVDEPGAAVPPPAPIGTPSPAPPGVAAGAPASATTHAAPSPAGGSSRTPQTPEVPVSPSSYGLAPARQTIRLFTRQGKEIATVGLGAAVPGETDRIYSKVETPEAPPTIAVVSSTGLTGLAKPAADFRARKALAFRTWDAGGLNLTSPTVTLSFKKKDTAWTATAPPSLKPAAGAIEDTLKALADLEIVSYDAAKGAAPSALGLDPERTRVEVLIDGGTGKTRTETLTLGASPAGSPNVVYARASDRPGVFTVAATILARIQGGPALYEEKAEKEKPAGASKGAANSEGGPPDSDKGPSEPENGND